MKSNACLGGIKCNNIKVKTSGGRNITGETGRRKKDREEKNGKTMRRKMGTAITKRRRRKTRRKRNKSKHAAHKYFVKKAQEKNGY